MTPACIRIAQSAPWYISKSNAYLVPNKTLSKFLDFSEILENLLDGQIWAKAYRLGNCAPAFLSAVPLKPQRDSSSNRTAARGQLREHLSVFSCRLRIEQISRVENRLRTNR